MRINETYLKNVKQNPDVLQGLLERHGVPGMSLTVIEKGQPVYSAVCGLRDDKGNPVEAGTLFECASLTKSLFAMLVMRLAGEGRLVLDQPIAAQYDHEHWSGDLRYPGITPLHCMSHGAGLPNWGPKPMEIAFDPGTRFSYSGEGYYLLQNMVEQMEGRPLEESFAEYFYKPWDMRHTAVDWTPEVGSQMSWGYNMDGKVCKIRDCRDEEGFAPEPNAAWSLHHRRLCEIYLPIDSGTGRSERRNV